MPSITNSIARAPSNRPNIFSITVRIVGPSLEDSIDDSHIDIDAIAITKKIGRYEIAASEKLI